MNRCEGEDPDPFGSPRGGMSLTALTPAEQETFRAQASLAAGDEVPADAYVIERVVVRGRVVGAAVAYPGVGYEREAVASFQQGMAHGMGGTTRPAEPGEHAALIETPAGVAVAGANGCWGVAVIGQSGDDAVRMARSLVAG